MSKDAYWFKHDCNATRDIKLIELRAIHNLDGLAMYWMILEVMREQNNYAWHYDKINILSSMISVPSEKLKNFISDCIRIDLFKVKENYIFSQRLLDDMKVWETRQKNRLGKTKQKRNKNESNNENVTKQEDEIKERERIKGNGFVYRGDWASPEDRQKWKSYPLPPPKKIDGITEKEVIAILQIPYSERTPDQKEQVFYFTNKSDFPIEKYQLPNPLIPV